MSTRKTNDQRLEKQAAERALRFRKPAKPEKEKPAATAKEKGGKKTTKKKDK